MKENWGIIGHEKIIDFLDSSLKNNQLTHAYFFTGLPNLGKTLVAEEFAKRILGSQAAWNLDVTKLEINEENSEILIEQAHEWRRSLFLKPFSGQRKIGLIYGAENLNEASGNSLLKIIEEPAEGTIILIVASGADSVLSTIISRSQVIKFLPVKEETIASALAIRLGGDKKVIVKAAEAAMLSAGRPGIAIKLLEDKKFFNAIKRYREVAEKIFFEDKAEFWPIAEKLLKSQEGFIGKGREVLAVAEQLEILIHRALLVDYGLDQAEKTAAENLQMRRFNGGFTSALSLINSAKRDLSHNVQPKLILENLFINL